MPASAINFSNTTPAAPAGKKNVGWQNDGGSPTCNESAYVDAPFSIAPTTLPAPNGGTSYTLPASVTNPTGSFYFVNGIKRIYGTYYTISGTTLTILASPPPQTGDTHELYAT